MLRHPELVGVTTTIVRSQTIGSFVVNYTVEKFLKLLCSLGIMYGLAHVCLLVSLLNKIENNASVKDNLACAPICDIRIPLITILQISISIIYIISA
jgi:hypothetical protein